MEGSLREDGGSGSCCMLYLGSWGCCCFIRSIQILLKEVADREGSGGIRFVVRVLLMLLQFTITSWVFSIVFSGPLESASN